MNRFTTDPARSRSSFSLLAMLIASLLLLSACVNRPHSPEGATEVRNKLSALQNDSELAQRVRSELRDAEQAVMLAERPLPASEAALAAHRVYMADHQVEIARARAVTKLAEDQRRQLDQARSSARLQARTREADRAYAQAGEARRSEADMQRRYDELQARPSDRGMVITLGDVLFDTGSAQLRAGANSTLDKLVEFLGQYPTQRVLIEGHTDNVGSASFNQRLSLQRAEAVKQYLTQQGVLSHRLSVSGMGLQRPIADNENASGRQQNRRVELVIENPPGSE